MEQQINLHQPIMGAEKRLFSARAIGIALGIFTVCLVALAGFGAGRIDRIERSVGETERRAAANMAIAGRAGVVLRPRQSLADLDAEAKVLSSGIDARQRALEVIERNGASPATGFAARLEALARRQMDGIWLSNIIVGSGEGRLGMRGATTDAKLVPAYLAALAQEQALAGVRFDKLSMRRALPDEAPALVVFEIDGPGLVPQKEEAAP
jgi:hypothetical protein